MKYSPTFVVVAFRRIQPPSPAVTTTPSGMEGGHEGVRRGFEFDEDAVQLGQGADQIDHARDENEKNVCSTIGLDVFGLGQGG
jgi:hypothetical protein